MLEKICRETCYTPNHLFHYSVLYSAQEKWPQRLSLRNDREKKLCGNDETGGIRCARFTSPRIRKRRSEKMAEIATHVIGCVKDIFRTV